MEAEDAQRLQLATAYIAMSGSLAWRDLMADLETSCETLELQAASARPEQKQHFEEYFSQWQQRKYVLAWMKKRVNDQAALKAVLEEEIQNGTDDLGTYARP